MERYVHSGTQWQQTIALLSIRREPAELHDEEQFWCPEHPHGRLEIDEVVGKAVQAQIFTAGYAKVSAGDENWQNPQVPAADMFAWD